jgi:two-component system sensor histidine kinase DegS
MREELNGRLQDILDRTGESLNSSIDHVVEIRDDVLKGLRELERELERVRLEVSQIIEANEQVGEAYRKARIALAEAARSGADLQAKAYEEAERLMRLKGGFEERERSLRRRRDDLEREIQRLHRILGRSEEMMSKLRLALKVLVNRLEDLSLSETERDSHLSAFALQFAERETARLAREIHDGPAQTFAGGVLMLDGLERLLELGEPERVRAEIRKIRGQMGEGLAEFRAFLTLLQPPGLDRGVESAIGRFAEQVRDRTGVPIEVRLEGNWSRLIAPHAANVLRIIQEAVSNALRHGKARNVRILGSVGRDVATLRVADDGAGFDYGMERERARERGSYGLANMEERVRLCGGTLRIESVLGRGTTVTWTVPLGEVGE